MANVQVVPIPLELGPPATSQRLEQFRHDALPPHHAAAGHFQYPSSHKEALGMLGEMHLWSDFHRLLNEPEWRAAIEAEPFPTAYVPKPELNKDDEAALAEHAHAMIEGSGVLTLVGRPIEALWAQPGIYREAVGLFTRTAERIQFPLYDLYLIACFEPGQQPVNRWLQLLGILALDDEARAKQKVSLQNRAPIVPGLESDYGFNYASAAVPGDQHYVGGVGTVSPSEPQLDCIIKASEQDLGDFVLQDQWTWDLSLEAVAERLGLDRIAGLPVSDATWLAFQASNDISQHIVCVADDNGDMRTELRPARDLEIMPSFLHPYICIATTVWYHSQLSSFRPVVLDTKEARILRKCQYAARLLSVHNAAAFTAALAQRPSEDLPFPAPQPPPADAKGTRRFYC